MSGTGSPLPGLAVLPADPLATFCSALASVFAPAPVSAGVSVVLGVFADDEPRVSGLTSSVFPVDGSVIGRYFSLYLDTCQDGHWGIQFGSGSGS